MGPLAYIICALVGYCPDPKPFPKPGPIPKEPISGILGGIAGGYLVYVALGLQGSPTGPEFVAILIGAFAAGRVFQEVASWIFRDKPRE